MHGARDSPNSERRPLSRRGTLQSAGAARRGPWTARPDARRVRSRRSGEIIPVAAADLRTSLLPYRTSRVPPPLQTPLPAARRPRSARAAPIARTPPAAAARRCRPQTRGRPADAREHLCVAAARPAATVMGSVGSGAPAASSPTFELVPGRPVGGTHPAYFIAEGGINHNGEMETARALIVAAKAVNADAIKFQKRTVEAIFTRAALDKPYLSENAFASTYGEHKKVLEFDEAQWRELKEHADSVGITLCGSGWDEGAVDMLERIGVPFFKMASADLLNFPLLEHTAKKGKPIIISTGMSTMEDVDAAVQHLRKFTSKIVLMQCTSTYPSKPELIHLNVLKTYAARFPDTVLGYSGHESGVVISQAAMCLGACVVEKHFTLDRTMRGSDHAASLELSGFRDLVMGRRKVEKALGGFVKCLQPGEAPMKAKLAKSAVSTMPIKKGTVVTREMITFKSPGDAIPPHKIDDVLVGKTAKKDIEEDVTFDPSWVE